MLPIKTMYELPAPAERIEEGLLRSSWFPEVLTYAANFTETAFEEMQSEGLVEVRKIIGAQHDSRRFISMYSIWFKAMPVMLVQNSGREGDDFSRRMITNLPQYKALCQYLQSKIDIEIDESDVVDGDAMVFEEELFKFHGSTDYGAQYGYPCQPKTEGFMLLPDAHRVLGEGPADLSFIAGLPDVSMPEYLRRHLCVLEKVRPVSDAELTNNPRVLPYYQKEGFTQFYWYRVCEVPVGKEPVVF